VPWLPSQIEQREGRIERQGNQHPEIEIYAYATLGSMDATMWQNNERKARFIEAALSGDRTIRRLEEEGGQANQFAMAKAIASGDSRLMRKAGLESEIARLRRQRAAQVDDQHAIRRQIRDASRDRAHAEARIVAITADLAQRRSTRGDAFTMEVEGRTITQRKVAGGSLLTKVRFAARERIARTWTVGRIGGFGRSLVLIRVAGALIDFDQRLHVFAVVPPVGSHVGRRGMRHGDAAGLFQTAKKLTRSFNAGELLERWWQGAHTAPAVDHVAMPVGIEQAPLISE
jgi:hypothetical protein